MPARRHPRDASINDFDIHTTVRGAVSPAAREYAERRIAGLARLTPRPVLFARLELLQEPDAALERGSVVKASLDVSGRRLRAHVAAPTMAQAADEVEARLRRGLEILAERREARYHDTGRAEAGEWRHGDLPTARPDFFPRPPEERQIMRRATFGIAPMTPEEAVVEMELLHHGFLLFIDSATGVESVVYRRPGDVHGLIVAGTPTERFQPSVDWITVDQAPAPRLTTPAAIERLDLSEDPFVFFVDAERNRGSVVYRRYDGHYGLIEPRDEGGTGGPTAASHSQPLRRSSKGMFVHEAMAKTICTASPTDTVSAVARMMRDNDCGFIPIVEAGRLVGVVTDRDIVIRCLADALADVGGVQISTLMSPSAWTIDAGATVEEAAHVMAEHEVRRLPVMSKGNLVGVLSYGNLEQAVHAEGPAAAEATLGVTRGA
jgi:CBS domain-containing protein/ribosome-associated translation inhibitor RaiA